MPRGIFLLIKDEIKGPEIKCSYSELPFDLSPQFISNLYRSHAGFEAASTLNVELKNFKILSCFTGHVARTGQKEGIIGIVLEKNETSDNLELFLRRNLSYGLMKPDDQTIKEIFGLKLTNYLNLIQIFNSVSIEKIPEIFIVNGDQDYKSNLLRIGVKKASTQKMASIYERILGNQKVPQFQYYKLNVDVANNTFLIVKIHKPHQYIDKIFSV
ncbi:MAG: hypothetical protein HWN66_17565, partial [Candidatus Helarchaeota archaeon]|nr:hypothetical protein [Candidatus Helarchaeota archaeon]